jgi:hypothetical protein
MYLFLNKSFLLIKQAPINQVNHNPQSHRGNILSEVYDIMQIESLIFIIVNLKIL